MEVLENRPLHSSTLRYSLEVSHILIIVKLIKDTAKHNNKSLYLSTKVFVSGVTPAVSCQQGILGTGKVNLNLGLFIYYVSWERGSGK